MNGVDRADQLRSTYSICRKAAKWWKYLFWFKVDVAICNAIILMKESPNHIITTKSGRRRERIQLEFRKKLAHQLLGDYWGKRKRESIGEHQTRGLSHWPTEMDKSDLVNSARKTRSGERGYTDVSNVVWTCVLHVSSHTTEKSIQNCLIKQINNGKLKKKPVICELEKKLHMLFF